jgi:nitrite reductase (NADH) large subunit
LEVLFGCGQSEGQTLQLSGCPVADQADAVASRFAAPQNTSGTDFDSSIGTFDPALPFIVVGGGPTGMRAAQELARRSDRRVILFSDERWGPYNRVKLTPLLAREVNLGQVTQTLDLETAEKVTRIDACRVVSINPESRRLIDHRGREWGYEALVLATGSRPHRPPIPGIELAGVFTFRSLNDAEALMARAERSRHTAVVGGGLLGLEAARGMFERGVPVTVIEHESRLMARQLDRDGGTMLRSEVEALGLSVQTSVFVRQIVGTLRVDGLFLSNGEDLACDTVILCTGVRSNRELGLEARLAVGQGIRVDDRMRTSDPHIYAVGECAEHDGVVEGLVAPGLEQARVAASAILGERAHYRRALPTTRLKVVGASVFSTGDVEQADQRTDIRSVVFAAGNDRRYRRLILRNGRLRGVIAVGDWDEVGKVQQLVAREGRIWPWQLRRFARTGILLGETLPDSVLAWPSAATVCNCTGVTRGQLGLAVSGGCTTVEALARFTSASTVCGGCRPLLQDLLGGDAPTEPVKHGRILAVLSLLALVGGGLTSLLPNWPAAASFTTEFTVDKLFNDGVLKQISGFALLALSAFAILLSARKRLDWLRLGDFAGWRLVHLVLGVVALATLAAHTGFSLGENLNFALITVFLATLVAGAAGGGIIAAEHRLAAIPAVRNRQVDPRRIAVWLHILACWPLPALLMIHILTVYFY